MNSLQKVMVLQDALAGAMAQFMFYEESHRQKGKLDKALINGKYKKACEDALRKTGYYD